MHTCPWREISPELSPARSHAPLSGSTPRSRDLPCVQAICKFIAILARSCTLKTTNFAPAWGSDAIRQFCESEQTNRGAICSMRKKQRSKGDKARCGSHIQLKREIVGSIRLITLPAATCPVLLARVTKKTRPRTLQLG